ncbi:hypothetical protein [Cellulomonas massiliensis]|uniref:hypothetical protein n=1 Tax=Cellulomonas massiliensis TaxID=1465811 RepID=UPI0011C92390|nr:hypothetical protein [Cellulomonas massiliensis]
MRWRAGRRTWLGGVVAAGVLAGGLAGCSGAPGVAATVDGRTITTAQVGAAYEQLHPYLPAAASSDILAAMIQEPVYSRLADEAGVGVSDDAAVSLLDQVVQQAAQANGTEAAPAPDWNDSSVLVGRYVVALNNLGAADDPQAAAAATAAMQSADVEVNPRFGSFDPNGMLVAPTTPAWITKPGAAGGATPQPTEEPTP